MRFWPVSIAALLLQVACIKPPPSDVLTAPAKAEAPALLWRAGAVNTLYERGEVRAWALRQGGHELGVTWGRYVGELEETPGVHRFETRVELTIPGRAPLRSQGVVFLDANGHLVRSEDRTMAAQVRSQREGDRLLVDNNGATFELSYDPNRRDTAFWADTAIFHEEMMFGLRDMQKGPLDWRVVSLSGASPIEWHGDAAPRIHHGVDAVEVRTSLGETLVLVDRRIEEVTVEDDRLTIEVIEPPPPWPSWEVQAPAVAHYRVAPDAPFVVREVEIPATEDDPRLAGEVLIPSSVTLPAPGVLFLAGAGPQDRHGLSGVPPVDLGSHEITDGLAVAGFAVLRYDDRGVGRSDAAALSFAGQVRDAKRALATLVVQDDVDPDRIVLVGHGEGGWRALMLAANSPFVQGVALLAAPGRDYGDVLSDQAEVTFSRLPPTLRREARENHERMIARIRDRDSSTEVPIAEAQWLQELLHVDPDRLIADVSVPLWFAQGNKDFEVDSTKDLEALVSAARRHGRRFEVVRYEDLDHLFMPEPEESSPERYRVPGRNVDPTVIEDLVRWLRKVLPS